MKHETKKPVVFLLAIPLVMLLFASCSSAPKKVELTDETTQHWNRQVDKIIDEPERAARLKSLGQQLVAVSEEIQQHVEVFNQQVMTLNKDYDASHEQLQQLIGEYSAQRNPMFAEYRDIVFAMRNEVTPGEWKALYD